MIDPKVPKVPYVPGQTYELATLADVFELYARLPAERGALFLEEICTAIRVTAPSIKMVATVAGLFSAANVAAEPIRWTDDDAGTGEINFKSQDGEPLVSLHVEMERPGS